MSVPDNTEDLDPELLRKAIQQLERELPDLLGTEYFSFAAKLELLVSQGSNEELLALFAQYPFVYEQLLLHLNFLTAGHGLYGKPVSDRLGTGYICPEGFHFVDASEVQKRDRVGRPLCPTHGRPMKPYNGG